MIAQLMSKSLSTAIMMGLFSKENKHFILQKIYIKSFLRAELNATLAPQHRHVRTKAKPKSIILVVYRK